MIAQPPLTILDLAYDILVWAGEPLPTDDIAAAAQQAGYDLDGWEIEAEINAHIDGYGPRALFVEMDRSWYGVQFDPPDAWPAPRQPTFGWLVVAGMLGLLVVLLFLTRNSPLGDLRPLVDLVKQAAPLIEGSALQPLAAEPPPAAPPAPPLPGPMDPDWWAANAENQINESTQAVARQYLSNYYNTCGPAVIATMVNYHRSHLSSAAGQLRTAAVLQDARTLLGFYTPPYNSGLLNFDHLRSLANLYGLAQSFPAGDNAFLSLDDLLARLRQGDPAIVGMRYHYRQDNRYQPVGGSGYNSFNHFVIAFAVEPVDGAEALWLLNPHPGKHLYADQDVVPEQVSLDQFLASWAINDGSAYSSFGYAAFYQLQP